MIVIIAALDEARAIGKNNNLPWHLKEDLAFFHRTTKNHTVVMGRKTYESIISKIGKPLPNRRNIILTRRHDFYIQHPDCHVVHSYHEILEITHDIFVIGGSEIYELFLPYATKLLLTRVHTIIHDADAFFPAFEGFKLISNITHDCREGEEYAFSFETWEKI